MSDFADLRHALQVGEAIVGGLETIEKLTHVGGEKAEVALHAIRASLHALAGVGTGTVSPQAALSQIESYHSAVTENREAALAELKRRFPSP